MTNDIVKNNGVIEISTWPISIFSRSIEIKISNEQPQIIIPNFQIIEPIDK
jgi:hypothetical protein